MVENWTLIPEILELALLQQAVLCCMRSSLEDSDPALTWTHAGIRKRMEALAH